MKIKEILNRDDFEIGNVIYDKNIDKHYMLGLNWVGFGTFGCVIDLEQGTVIKDDTMNNSVVFWEDFFGDDDVFLVDELTAVREMEEDNDRD